jgi:hypothetical protein
VSSASDVESVPPRSVTTSSTSRVPRFPSIRRFITAVLIAEDPYPSYSKLDHLDGLPERSTNP